jgi:hypothetical protein
MPGLVVEPKMSMPLAAKSLLPSAEEAIEVHPLGGALGFQVTPESADV